MRAQYVRLVDAVREPLGLLTYASASYLRSRPSRMWHLLGGFVDGDLVAHAPRVQAPTLLIRGEHDPVCRVEWVRELGAHLPDARAVELAGSTHGLQSKKPEEFARVVRDFLAAPDPHGAAVLEGHDVTSVSVCRSPDAAGAL